MKIDLNTTDKFQYRHIGPDSEETQSMLKTVGVDSIEELIGQTIPEAIRLDKPMNIPAALSEGQYLQLLREKAKHNKVYRSYIGLGYYGTITPTVIKRNIFENPGWYTQYTPYQAEISQGRLEALLNFQTMVADLTGMPIANASLLDEGTAAAEAMIMFFNQRNKRKIKAPRFLVSEDCLPQTIDIIKTRALPLGIEVEVGNTDEFVFDDTVFATLVQYPNTAGAVKDYSQLAEKAHDAGTMVIAAADILSLALLTPPGEWGADCAVGNTQRLGVPMGFGGPHAAYFATTEKYKRSIPGRIIGVSVDSHGNRGLRMALQTREQHIRREKATSNICTAQALLAIMAGMYGAYHGPKGVKNIALRIHQLTALLAAELEEMGFKQVNEYYFDTLSLDFRGQESHLEAVKAIAAEKEINFGYYNDHFVRIALDETVRVSDVEDILTVFAQAKGLTFEKTLPTEVEVKTRIPERLQRTSEYLQHPVFNQHHSETEMMRYIKSLENKDLSLTHSMIPLGSCTMKLNAATQLEPVSWPEFGAIHPFAPVRQVGGYLQILSELENYLNEITGFAATSLQPNSGAQGEYAGLMVIRAYHLDHGDDHRDVALIPSSAHGTNPASAVMAGMKVVVVKCDENGNIDVGDLREKAEQYSDRLSALMITYPSTHGVFEESVQEVCQIIHDHGGLVYMDGANMNAQVGLTNPGIIGADVCHLNLHKTFAIPHGGGGPGMGPICCTKELAPYLPGHSLTRTGGEKGITAISSAPWGSSSILLISYAYIKMLGEKGLTDSTNYAILNANYIKSKLDGPYQVLYKGANDRVAHELILDFRPFKEGGVEVEDAAKRLMDYGFHAPTMSFPVPGTMMVEPTESESQDELDRFCDAMLAIREEIAAVEKGEADKEDNVLKNAPHTQQTVITATWNHPYPREQAVYPLPYVSANKFWPPVGRVDNAHGDRNLICTCPPMDAYEEEEPAMAE